MTNKIVQGALDGKLGVSQNLGVKLTTGTHIKSEGNPGKEMERRKSTDSLERRGRGKKKKALGEESFSVSYLLPPGKPRFLYLPIAPHHKGEGLLLQPHLSLVQVTEVCVGDLNVPADVYQLDATTWNFHFYNPDNYILHPLCPQQKDYKVRPSKAGNARVKIACMPVLKDHR